MVKEGIFLLTKRMIKIIKILSHDKQPKSSREICANLGITARTLRSDVRKSNEVIKNHGFKIQSNPGVGYALKINDENLYYKFIEYEMKKNFDKQLVIPDYPEDRVHYIIRKLLIAEDYLTIESLSDELFVSRSTLDNDMKNVREKLSFFHLKLANKPSYGIKIKGSEFHLRSCISMYYFSMDETEVHSIITPFNRDKIQQDISEILYSVMEDKSFKLTHIGFENLIIHLIIAISRLRKPAKNNIKVSKYEIMETYEFEVAELLSKRLEQNFDLEFPLIEKIYIAMHLSGKQASQYLDRSIISMDESNEIFRRFFIEIQKQFNLDLSSDLNLLTALILHFQPMKSRIDYGIYLQNPLLDQIKLDNPLAFDISVVMAKIINEEWNCEISEDEIGYLALHFALSIENQETEQNKKNILIVCASGVGSSQILYHKVLTKFRDSIGNIKVIELYALEATDLSSFDILLSTVPLQKDYEIPIIYVKYFLSDENILQINSVINEEENINLHDFFSEDLFFSNLESREREEIILEMCEKIRSKINLPEKFEEEVIKREKYAATEYGNNIAIPHPMQPITDKTFVAIGTLSRPVLWEETYVKYIFLLSISTNNNESSGLLHEVLASFTINKEALAKFDRSPTIITFNEIISDLYNQNESNDIDSIFN